MGRAKHPHRCLKRRFRSLLEGAKARRCRDRSLTSMSAACGHVALPTAILSLTAMIAAVQSAVANDTYPSRAVRIIVIFSQFTGRSVPSVAVIGCRGPSLGTASHAYWEPRRRSRSEASAAPSSRAFAYHFFAASRLGSIPMTRRVSNS
jgi:hypothetical protein